jgi:hypothetical protein
MSDITDTPPKLVVALNYSDGIDFIRRDWPDEDPRGLNIVATEGGTNAALLAGAWYAEGEVEWTPRCFRGRFYPEVASAVKCRIARV